MNILIVLAAYQGAAYISEQLDTLIAQSIPVDILIRDDGSRDATVRIVEEYEKKYPQISMLREVLGGGGPKQNFSVLLEHAATLSYDYIMCCDQDDIWHVDKVKKSLEKMKELEKKYGTEVPLLVHTDLELVSEAGKAFAPSFWVYNGFDPLKNTVARLLMDNTVTGCTMMINSVLLMHARPIPGEAVMHDSWYSLVAASFGVIGIVAQPTMGYRQHEINVIGAIGKESFLRKAVIAIQMTLQRKTRVAKLQERVVQAKAYYRQYHQLLSEEDRAVVLAFSQLLELPLMGRVVAFFKYGFYKQRVVKTIGILLVLLLPTRGIYKK